MTSLLDHLEAHGHTMSPGDDPLPAAAPGACWQEVDQNVPVGNVVVWADPALRRGDFQPTVVASTARITPPVDAATVLARLDDTAATLADWRTRSSRRTADDGGRVTSDTLGDYRLGEHHLTASTRAWVWTDGNATVLRQVVVTTFTDQLPTHAAALDGLT